MKRTCFSYISSKNSASRSRSILRPSRRRNSPPSSAGLKHTNAARRGERVPTCSLCMPTKYLARDSLFTASYTPFSLSTASRAATDWSGSSHGSRPRARYIFRKPSLSLVISKPRMTIEPYCAMRVLIVGRRQRKYSSSSSSPASAAITSALFHSGANSPEGFARSSARLTSRAPHAVIGHSTTPGKVSSIRVAGGSGVGGAAFTGTDTPGGVSEDTMDR
mmetsp:Transcript_16628/g.34713  ORF Transcript_16628/g.34713 Transcript_16628/m.34713 type:complete len:220 (-) Transcript_16628:159-818(-)